MQSLQRAAPPTQSQEVHWEPLNYSKSGKVWTRANGLHAPDVQSENIY